MLDDTMIAERMFRAFDQNKDREVSFIKATPAPPTTPLTCHLRLISDIKSVLWCEVTNNGDSYAKNVSYSSVWSVTAAAV